MTGNIKMTHVVFGLVLVAHIGLLQVSRCETEQSETEEPKLEFPIEGWSEVISLDKLERELNKPMHQEVAPSKVGYQLMRSIDKSNSSAFLNKYSVLDLLTLEKIDETKLKFCNRGEVLVRSQLCDEFGDHAEKNIYKNLFLYCDHWVLEYHKACEESIPEILYGYILKRIRDPMGKLKDFLSSFEAFLLKDGDEAASDKENMVEFLKVPKYRKQGLKVEHICEQVVEDFETSVAFFDEQAELSREYWRKIPMDEKYGFKIPKNSRIPLEAEAAALCKPYMDAVEVLKKSDGAQQSDDKAEQNNAPLKRLKLYSKFGRQ